MNTKAEERQDEMQRLNLLWSWYWHRRCLAESARPEVERHEEEAERIAEKLSSKAGGS